MLKTILCPLIIIIAYSVSAQVNSTNQILVNGKIGQKLISTDTVYFNTGVIDKKYFEISLISSQVINNQFNIKPALSYPQMFRTVFASDKNIRVWRFGKYFIDKSTTFINVDYLSEKCNEVDGETSNEYQNKFVPFLSKNLIQDCKATQIEKLLLDKSTSYDSTLFKYVLKNPDSYVALWSLIERFSLFGHSEVREKTLNRFSDKLKKSKIWATLQKDIDSSGIKENKKFPHFNVKTIGFQDRILTIPNAKYTLIDFWFSRCRPCLEAFPSLKKIYDTYQSKGFEIVSISTDATKELSLWQKRIIENELTWLQYLDENGREAKKLSIFSYPSTFLLNDKGEIIRKGINPKDLEKFLKENL